MKFIVTAIINGDVTEIEREADAGWLASSAVKEEFGSRTRIISSIPKELIEQNKEINRRNNITQEYMR